MNQKPFGYTAAVKATLNSAELNNKYRSLK